MTGTRISNLVLTSRHRADTETGFSRGRSPWRPIGVNRILTWCLQIHRLHGLLASSETTGKRCDPLSVCPSVWEPGSERCLVLSGWQRGVLLGSADPALGLGLLAAAGAPSARVPSLWVSGCPSQLPPLTPGSVVGALGFRWWSCLTASSLEAENTLSQSRSSF